MTRAQALAIERLLEEAGWLESLAVRLVGDAQLASDLSQETWVRALEHPPRTDQPVRGWLATVMRNVLRQKRRGEGRRARRERAAARREALPSSLELVERVASQRDLAHRVLDLDEPYRTTLLLRFYEGLEPRRIAERQGIPVSTVKTRLSRGLERLREDLDRSAGGDGTSWLAGLAPLLQPRAGAAPGASTTGALLMNAKILPALTLLGAAAAGIVVILRPSPERAPVLEPAEAPVAALEPERRLAADPAEASLAVRGRRPAEAPRTEPPAHGATEVGELEAVLVRGRVVDVDGKPVPGIELEHTGGGRRFFADAAGAFEVSVEESGRFRCADEAYETVLEGTEIAARTGRESIVVVAPRIRLGGRVIDVHGVPLARASLRLTPPADLRARVGAVLDHSADLSWSTVSDAEGTFALTGPAIRGARLEVGLPGHAPLEDPAPGRDRLDLLLVLEPLVAGTARVEGQVVDGSGIPVEDALVSLGADTTRSEEDGRFAFDLESPKTYTSMLAEFLPGFGPHHLRAVKPGFLPGHAEAERDEEGNALWPELVVLRLGAQPLSIRGRVIDAEDRPLPGIRVWVDDPTFFGALGDPTAGERPQLMHVETLVASAPASSELQRPGWSWVETDAEGRFRLPGLLDREYTISALHSTTLLRVDRRGVRAGSEGVELRLPPEASFDVLRGTVVDGSGAPVAGAEIFPMCDAFGFRIAGRRVSTYHSRTAGVQTDERGRFELRDVPRDLVYLRIDGEDTIPLEWGRHVEGGLATLVGDPARVEIQVARRCHFRVELDGPEEADQLAVLDADGEPLVVSEFRGTGRVERERHSMLDGRSGTLAVSEEARTLVLFRNGVEVRRVPIHLSGGGEHTLRP